MSWWEINIVIPTRCRTVHTGKSVPGTDSRSSHCFALIVHHFAQWVTAAYEERKFELLQVYSITWKFMYLLFSILCDVSGCIFMCIPNWTKWCMHRRDWKTNWWVCKLLNVTCLRLNDVCVECSSTFIFSAVWSYGSRKSQFLLRPGTTWNAWYYNWDLL